MSKPNFILYRKRYAFLLYALLTIGLFSCQDESVNPDGVTIEEQASTLSSKTGSRTNCDISGQQIVSPPTSQTYTYTHGGNIENPTVTWTSSSNITLSPSTGVNVVAQFATGFTQGWIRAVAVSSTNGLSCDEEITIIAGNNNCTPELTGPDPICVGQFSTYDWSCPGDVNWSVSGNLTIISETDSQVTVSGTSKGTGTITGTVNGVSLSKTVTINDRPIPSPPKPITGPDTLKYYQTGLFNTDLTVFDGYTDVEWVIYSFNFQNANVHFNLTHPLNSDHLAQVEVLPTAPEGMYYIQCRVINECGMYVIDKTFEVQEGPAQIFEF